MPRKPRLTPPDAPETRIFEVLFPKALLLGFPLSSPRVLPTRRGVPHDDRGLGVLGFSLQKFLQGHRGNPRHPLASKTSGRWWLFLSQDLWQNQQGFEITL